MRIYQAGTGMVAEARKKDGLFVCGPQGGNKISDEKTFASIQAAASFLCGNKTWGIRMNPEWDLVFRNIVIDRDN
ncbi:hypothetical protein [Sulfitobacter sp.]|uniref:hypothetical protein n=1 Tax=Sulfitobacter sp. TaxID=1903071 RepID=UPI003003925B